MLPDEFLARNVAAETSLAGIVLKLPRVSYPAKASAAKMLIPGEAAHHNEMIAPTVTE